MSRSGYPSQHGTFFDNGMISLASFNAVTRFLSEVSFISIIPKENTILNALEVKSVIVRVELF